MLFHITHTMRSCRCVQCCRRAAASVRVRSARQATPVGTHSSPGTSRQQHGNMATWWKKKKLHYVKPSNTHRYPGTLRGYMTTCPRFERVHDHMSKVPWNSERVHDHMSKVWEGTWPHVQGLRGYMTTCPTLEQWEGTWPHVQPWNSERVHDHMSKVFYFLKQGLLKVSFFSDSILENMQLSRIVLPKNSLFLGYVLLCLK